MCHGNSVSCRNTLGCSPTCAAMGRRGGRTSAQEGPCAPALKWFVMRSPPKVCGLGVVCTSLWLTRICAWRVCVACVRGAGARRHAQAVEGQLKEPQHGLVRFAARAARVRAGGRRGHCVVPVHAQRRHRSPRHGQRVRLWRLNVCDGPEQSPLCARPLGWSARRVVRWQEERALHRERSPRWPLVALR
jgi:hypothetical protein